MTAPLLTAAEVAERLAVSERYVWRLGRDGDLPRVELGKYVRFNPEDVDRFIENRTQGRRACARVAQPVDRVGPRSATPMRRFA